MTAKLLFDKKQVSNETPDDGLEAFYEDFLSSRSDELEVLNQAISDNDYEKIRKIAHNWKGFSKPYGFDTLEGLGKILEQAAKEKNNLKCTSVLENVKSYLKMKSI